MGVKSGETIVTQPAAISPSFVDGHDLLLELSFEEQFRYGENPGQQAWRYQVRARKDSPVLRQAAKGKIHRLPVLDNGEFQIQQHFGKPLSFNNYSELVSAQTVISRLPHSSVAVLKHGKPAGLAFAPTQAEARYLACQSAPQANFGGVEVYSEPLTIDSAEAIRADGQKSFETGKSVRDVIVVPGFEDKEACLERLSQARSGKYREDMRVVEVTTYRPPNLDIRIKAGQALIQEPMDYSLLRDDELIFATQKPIDEDLEIMRGLGLFAAIGDSNGVGLGDGRVDSRGKLEAAWTYGMASDIQRNGAAYLALWRANNVQALQEFGYEPRERSRGSMAFSDGFFLERSSIDMLAGAGIRGIISGDGGLRRDQVIAAAQEWQKAYVLMKRRMFSHSN